MNNINGTYRNPRHDEIADAIRQGMSDPAVAKRLGVARTGTSQDRCNPKSSAPKVIEAKEAAPVAYGPPKADRRCRRQGFPTWTRT